MNSDKLLIQLAADKAGIPIQGWTESGDAIVEINHPVMAIWNPLKYNSDCLELAVKSKADLSQIRRQIVQDIAQPTAK